MLKAIVVVPCYNEQKRLNLKAFKATLEASPWLGFLFVNDGSSDQTLSMLTRFADDHPQQVGVLSNNVNRGKAASVRRGLSTAIGYHPEYIGFWDADLATPLSEIADFCNILDKRDDISIVVGTRLALLGRQIERKATRRILGRVFSLVASSTLAIPIRDTQCGAKMFRVDRGIDAIFDSPFCSKWVFDVEIFARMIMRQKSTNAPAISNAIYEKPLESWFEIPGSKLKAIDFVKAAVELGVIYWKYLGPFRRQRMPVRSEPMTIPMEMFQNNGPLKVAQSERRQVA